MIPNGAVQPMVVDSMKLNTIHVVHCNVMYCNVMHRNVMQYNGMHLRCYRIQCSALQCIMFVLPVPNGAVQPIDLGSMKLNTLDSVSWVEKKRSRLERLLWKKN